MGVHSPRTAGSTCSSRHAPDRLRRGRVGRPVLGHLDRGCLENCDPHPLVGSRLVFLACVPERGLSRMDLESDSVVASDPACALEDDEELLEHSRVAPETSSGTHRENCPSSTAPEPDASKVMCRDTAELVDRVTGFGRDLDDLHDTILARWMAATACYATKS